MLRARGDQRLSIFAVVALLFSIFALVIGCRGAVERVYDDAVLTGSQGDGGVEGGKGSDSGSTADAAPKPQAPAKIGGTIVGVVGMGLTLQNNGGDDLTITAGGAFSFATPVSPGQPYEVTVRSQPTAPTQTCTVTKGSGTADGVDIIDVTVTCVTNAYPVGGTVVGLSGTGLVLQNNGGNDLAVTANGDFTFTQNVPSGASFNISVKTQPMGPVQTCNVSGATGTLVGAAVSSVVVNCLNNTYTVGGTVSGLAGTLVIRNNGGDNRTITANGSFAFPTPIPSGNNYAVTVLTQPTYPPSAQTCTITNGSGSVSSANITNVSISCTTATFTVGGNVTGLNSTGLVLQNNAGNNKTINASGAFTFGNSVASGSPYNVTILSQPSADKCVVSSGGGTVTNGNITNVSITCYPLVVLSENFDGVTPPNLPPGWTTQILRNDFGGGVVAFETEVDNANSAPNMVHAHNYDNVTDIVLNSPPLNIASATAKVSFWNKYNTEFDYDGGVLEISIAGGAFQDIIVAGGAFVSGGYNHNISTACANPIAGKPAWQGSDTVQTIVNLPAAANGKSIVLRWRSTSDEGYVVAAWYIDDIVVTN